MQMTISTGCRQIGNLTIDNEIKVVALDAGDAPTRLIQGRGKVGVASSTLNQVLSQMAIIVPCKNEPPETIEGVLMGIPQPCTIILVSNSTEDRYAKELAMVREFCCDGWRVFSIHQKDATAAKAIDDAGMPDILDDCCLIRDGKGEGMILGLALVAALCPTIQYVGFVDADSKIPGSPNEYCKIYASGFALSGHPSASAHEHVMVRVHWAAKPKVREGAVDFSVKEGRSSRVVNEWLNRFLKLVWGPHGTPVTTANAGEHGMTMSLALKMRMAGGYAIEPFHYVDLLERQLNFVATPNTSPAASDAGGDGMYSDSASIASSHSGSSSSSSLDGVPVRVIQVRSLNPHFHTETDENHITAMWGTGLSTIYNYLLGSSEHDDEMAGLKSDMEEFVTEKTGDTRSLQPPMVYRPLEELDMSIFASGLENAPTLHRI